ncbi:hypothetical protein U1Q18_041457 [Sarracenia purpurea var. burkii]
MKAGQLATKAGQLQLSDESEQRGEPMVVKVGSWQIRGDPQKRALIGYRCHRSSLRSPEIDSKVNVNEELAGGNGRCREDRRR